MKLDARKPGARVWKRRLTVVTLILPFLYTTFIVADRFGVWDRLSGLDLVEQASDRFDLSYAADASNPVRVGDKEWKPLLKLVYRYSRADFIKDKQPRVIARLQATLSTRTPQEGPIEAEWTAPSTPLVLMYRDWPMNTGKPVTQDEFRVIGTIGDLKDWISKAREDRKFLVGDIFLGTFGPLLGIVIFFLETGPKQTDSGANGIATER